MMFCIVEVKSDVTRLDALFLNVNEQLKFHFNINQ